MMAESSLINTEQAINQELKIKGASDSYQFNQSRHFDCLLKIIHKILFVIQQKKVLGNHKCEIKFKRRLQYKISHSPNIIFNIFLIIQYSQMAEQPQQTAQQTKKEAKANNRWTNISSDEDQSESEKSQKQQQVVVKPKQEETVPVQAEAIKEEGKKKEPNIVPFDPKKKFRGEFANIKTIKGGFKAQKLQQKKFRLDTVKNPFQIDDQSSDQEKQGQTAEQANLEQKQQDQIPVEQPTQTQQKAKKAKKSKKQQEKEELQALLKELNVETETKGEEGQKKKKKKKAKKEKVEGQDQTKHQTKAQEVKVQAATVQQQVANRQAIEEVMRKKAEAAKNAGKKAVKASVASNARKAIQQREAKNKQKKVYVDL